MNMEFNAFSSSAAILTCENCYCLFSRRIHWKNPNFLPGQVFIPPTSSPPLFFSCHSCQADETSLSQNQELCKWSRTEAITWLSWGISQEIVLLASVEQLYINSPKPKLCDCFSKILFSTLPIPVSLLQTKNFRSILPSGTHTWK